MEATMLRRFRVLVFTGSSLNMTSCYFLLPIVLSGGSVPL